MRRAALSASGMLIGLLVLTGVLPWAGDAASRQKPKPVRGHNVSVDHLRPGAVPQGVTLPPAQSKAPSGSAGGAQKPNQKAGDANSIVLDALVASVTWRAPPVRRDTR